MKARYAEHLLTYVLSFEFEEGDVTFAVDFLLTNTTTQEVGIILLYGVGLVADITFFRK